MVARALVRNESHVPADKFVGGHDGGKIGRGTTRRIRTDVANALDRYASKDVWIAFLRRYLAWVLEVCDTEVEDVHRLAVHSRQVIDS